MTTYDLSHARQSLARNVRLITSDIRDRARTFARRLADARDRSDRQEWSAAKARFEEERRRLWMR
ncbi:MAG TPA: hypothetical protein VHZ98_13085 [Galbitalea sp.]|nr:hypothetical protein [Galbitalea sp.]